MDISTLASSTSSTAQTSSSTTTMGKNDFLKLFVTQLQNQNPLSPMDSTGFTSQLAQFSSLEQLSNINTGVSNLALYQNSMQNALAAGLIGKTVKVADNQISLTGSADINYTLSEDASQVNLSIYDATGNRVRQVQLGRGSAGDAIYTWDGKDSQGATLPDGAYTFSVDAVASSGESVPVTSLTYGTVTAVTFENNTTYLVIDGRLKVRPGDIKEISN